MKSSESGAGETGTTGAGVLRVKKAGVDISGKKNTEKGGIETERTEAVFSGTADSDGGAGATETGFMARSVAVLPGIGARTAEKLGRFGIDTVGDLFYTLPRTYDNFTVVNRISELRPGKVVVRGRVEQVHSTFARSRKLTVTTATISDGTGALPVVWFNQEYREKQFRENPGQEYFFEGEFNLNRGRYQLQSPKVSKVTGGGCFGEAGGSELASETDRPTETGGQITPVYRAHGELNADAFRRIFGNLRAEFAKIPDLLPFSEENGEFVKGGTRAEALFRVHFPESEADVAGGRKYLAYEELFELILAAQLSKWENHRLRALPLRFDRKITQKLVKSLPFRLTPAQKKAAWEILQDLEKNRPMNRLLQGDVGSGKTVVAALAVLQTVKNGAQAAFLAPTAILAAQHAEKLGQMLSSLGVSVVLLTGATKGKEVMKKRIGQGRVDLVVGTHALFTDSTKFARLGLVVIDEQHRFGVEQRQKLLRKTPAGLAPHLLSMTATPIPRSLQLSIFGDLDISTIAQLPAGRRPIITKILPEIAVAEWVYPEVRRTLQTGGRVYWICRRIEDEPALETRGVKTQAKKLQRIFPEAQIEFLHGRMRAEEKDGVMERFASGEIDILVSTTVVEVGVDVPEATLMVITDAENYGLAQLHQLRGRVGRGERESTCFLVYSGEGRPSRRLREMAKSTDGFYLAEADLKMRGPGEIYGLLQHGVLSLRVANFSDAKMITAVSRHVREFLRTGKQADYAELMNRAQKYQQLTLLN